MSAPSVKLNNGHNIPIIGLGTWKSDPAEVGNAIKYAIDVGYRHIDCAFIYGNESTIGKAIKDKISNGDVKREDLFITSKLWNAFHDPKFVKAAIEKSLKSLQLDYLDLYLIHWPVAYKEIEGDLHPKNDKDELWFSDVDYVDTWKAMEELVDAGLVKSIGISNFNSKQIQRVIDVARIQPVMNQIECHPYLTQKKLIEFCRTRNIHVTAYSPLGSADRPGVKPGDKQIMDEPGLVDIAKQYNRTVAQILIRYQIQNGNIVIPKSVTMSHIASNFDVFNFELTKEDVATIDGFNVNDRFCALNTAADHPHYPFKEEF